MGFAVANPDYSTQFTLTPAEECRRSRPLEDEVTSFDGSLRIGVGPRIASTWPHDAPMVLTEFRQDVSGWLHVPKPVPWYLTELLATVGDANVKSGSHRTARLLKGMSSLRHSVHAVVELKEPLPEEQAGEIYGVQKNEVLLLSPGRGEKPIGWPYVFPGVIGAFDAYEDVEGPSRVAEFRRWVSLLREEDEPALEEVGLDLAELRLAAGEGLVHGFTVINTPDVVRHLAKDPQVRSVQVVEIVPAESDA
ncbi:hypothetical protein [Nonomuraea sp. SYSU D8015]|uniref:hypothetical protein n=1 Tax=Nonomuraea sp. SYSU D8015 TaxID=2593644 RepID=UPI001660E5D8|nr:hypothetical protein [Nonomuraea sp. SYSU D8015]